MNPLILRLSRRLLRTGLQRGLGGDRRWLVFAGVAGAVRIIAARSQLKKSDAVRHEILRAGETLVITTESAGEGDRLEVRREQP